MRGSELAYARSQNNIELHMMKSMAEIEVNKFANMVSAIGVDTLAAISRAGPETQVNNIIWATSNEFGTYRLCEQRSSGEPAHLRSLARTSTARSYKQ